MSIPNKWRTSSRSSPQNQNCVEVATNATTALIRDTKDREGGILKLSASAYTAFTSDIARPTREH